MNPAQASDLLSVLFRAGLPVLLKGAPGVGKSDLVEQAAARIGAALILSHPVVADPTDAKGLPWPDRGERATFLPFGDLATALAATEPTV